ncbi:MAG: hypothetical protein P8X57_12465, partial [Cyclobacteriaceae bacterium]
FIGLEAGIFFGAIMSGWIYGNQLKNIGNTFFFAAWMAAIALGLLIIYMSVWKKRRQARMVQQ